MFRPVAQGARCATRSILNQRAAFRSVIRPSFQSSPIAPALNISAIRFYASGSISKSEIEGRIMDLLKNFDKIQDASKITASSHFANDLGLDSLDTVEVVMAIEEEFSIEIPDKDADQIHSVDKAIDYIVNQPDAH